MPGKQNLYSFRSSKSGNEEFSYFLTRGRISRSTFLSRLIFALSLFLFFKLINVYCWRTDSPNYSVWINFYNYFLPLFLFIFVCVQAGKRIHDINKSAFNVFIPLLNIYYVFLLGTKGNNEFGIDPSPQKNIKYFDQISSFEASNNSNSSRKEIIKIFAILFLLYFSFYGIKINSGLTASTNAGIVDLPHINVIANVKNNAQLKIGFISVDALDKSKSLCLRKIFDNASIKYVQKNQIDQLIQALRNNRIDLLLLSPSESIRITEKFDRTNKFYIKSISRTAMFLIPPDNSDLVESLNDCIVDFNISK